MPRAHPDFPPPRFIDTTLELERACARLAGEQFVTLDTEFIRERTYWPELCVVQLAGSAEVLVVDAQAPDLDLAPLGRLLADPSVLKVVHSGRQDIEIFVQKFGAVPAPVFDTQIAAMVAGFGDQVAYDMLVSALAGGHIDKTHRFTDWSARPLSPAQIAYAAADVTWLRPVYERLRARLEAEGRVDWVAEEMAALADPSAYRADPETAWERLRPRSGNRRYLAMVRALAAWRERAAQRANVPRQRIVRDETLLEIAATQPQTAEALARARGLPRSLAEGSAGAEILDTIASVKAVPAEALPEGRTPREGRPSPALVALLKVLLAAKAEQHHVAARLVASSDDLERLALGEDSGLAVLHGWRRGVFGDEALALRAGRIALGVDDNRVRLIRL